MELLTIGDVLVMTRGNQKEAAELVHVNRGTFRKYMLGKLKGVVIKEDDNTLRLYGRLGENLKEK